MEFRSILYWSLSIMMLITCLIYPNNTPHKSAVSPLNLTSHIKVEPRFFYYSNNRFEALVIGQFRMDVTTDKINSPLTDYNALVINDFQFVQDTNYSLNWRVDEQSFQQLIYKTPQSITPIDFHTDDNNKISDMHILIEPNTAFGNHVKVQQMASFQSMFLDRLNINNQLSANISAWTHATPVQFNSINGYTSTQDLHMKSLVLRLSIWLLFNVAIFLMLKVSSKHILLTLFMGWIISTFFYSNNHINQHQQLSDAFQADRTGINQLDQEALTTTAAIKAAIKALPKNTSGIKKYIILGQNDFFNLRLMRHLFEFNIGLGLNFQKLLSKVNDQYGFILINRAQRYCVSTDKYDWLNNQTVTLVNNENFCIMRKK